MKIKKQKHLRNQTVTYKFETDWLHNYKLIMRRDVFQAIADPTRREIIRVISREPLNLNAVADKFKISRPAISKHIRILTECGLVQVNVKGRERYCEARLEKLNEVSEWLEQYRKFWTAKLDSLENYLEDLQAREKNNVSKKLNSTTRRKV